MFGRRARTLSRVFWQTKNFSCCGRFGSLALARRDFFGESTDLIRAGIFRLRSIVTTREGIARDAKLNKNSKSKDDARPFQPCPRHLRRGKR
jgi:hypothetical protein